MYCICIGHSHVGALKYEYILGRQLGKYGDLELEFVELHHTAQYEYYIQDHAAVDPKTEAVIGGIVAKRGEGPSAVFMTVGGSLQHALSLMNHQQPFDVLTSGESRSLDGRCAIFVPSNMVRELLLQRMVWKINLFKMLVKRFDCQKYFFQAPPPIADDEYIKANPGPSFAAVLEEYGVSPLSLRKNVSLIYSNIWRGLCSESGVEFLPPPQAALDENGCLHPAAREKDSIHANVVYGAHLIEQIKKVRSRI